MTPCRSTRVIINLCLVLSLLGTACWRGPRRSFCRPSIPCTTPSKAATEVVRARAPGRYLPRDGSGYPSASSLIGARPLVVQLVHGDPRSSTAVVRAATCRRLVSHILEHMMMHFWSAPSLCARLAAGPCATCEMQACSHGYTFAWAGTSDQRPAPAALKSTVSK